MNRKVLWKKKLSTIFYPRRSAIDGLARGSPIKSGVSAHAGLESTFFLTDERTARRETNVPLSATPPRYNLGSGISRERERERNAACCMAMVYRMGLSFPLPLAAISWSHQPRQKPARGWYMQRGPLGSVCVRTSGNTGVPRREPGSEGQRVTSLPAR